MISLRTLERLASDPSIPPRCRDAFRTTAELEAASRPLRTAALSQKKRAPAKLTDIPSVLIFDSHGSESLPGIFIEHPDTGGDASARRAFETTSSLARFYQGCFGRNSIDDAGNAILSSIHFSRAYCNASWNSQEMVYGDGDGLIFLDFTRSNDFIGHELTHGVTQYSAGLTYENEPGALNESISDVFGSMFRQWVAAQSVQAANWKIGADLMGPLAAERGWECVRDLANPGSPHNLTQQPSDYSHYIPGGDPHDNSGIPNHAFYLAAKAIGGKSWEKTGVVWYRSLTSTHATNAMTFRDFAKLTTDTAASSFPEDAGCKTAIKQAWESVGVPV